jgi:2-hydroxy-3-keto-5-methylthiopentenyl-1-phosphate phosphatase
MCAAKEADFVVAKSYLLDFCRTNRIACAPFKDFSEVEPLVSKKLNELQKAQPALAGDPQH